MGQKRGKALALLLAAAMTLNISGLTVWGTNGVHTPPLDSGNRQPPTDDPRRVVSWKFAENPGGLFLTEVEGKLCANLPAVEGGLSIEALEKLLPKEIEAEVLPGSVTVDSSAATVSIGISGWECAGYKAKTVPGENGQPDKTIWPDTGAYVFTAAVGEQYSFDGNQPEITVVAGVAAIGNGLQQEWDGTTDISSGNWVISAGKNITIDTIGTIYIENGAVLTIEPGATLTIAGGTVEVADSQIVGTVIVTGDGVIDNGQCTGGILNPYWSSTVEQVILRGGTLWFADGTIEKISIETGLADIFRDAQAENVTNSGGTMYLSQGATVKNLLNEKDGYSECGNGGRIDNATVTGSRDKGLYCWYHDSTGQGGSIGTVNISGYSILNIGAYCTVEKVTMDCGSYVAADYPLVNAMANAQIGTFEGRGGYVKNNGTMEQVTLLEATVKDIDFRNGDIYGNSGTVGTLTVEGGGFFNAGDSVLEKATLYDGILSQHSTVPISEVKMLESKSQKPDISTPDGAYLMLWEESVIENIHLSRGELCLYNRSRVVNLICSDDCTAVIEKNRDAVIENELTGMAAVSWEEPLNGSILVEYGGTKLSSGKLIPIGAEVTVTATPSNGYKLENSSLTANGVPVSAQPYKITGDTVFSASFILQAAAQPWDGTTDISTADTYDITSPVVISEPRSIAKEAIVHISGDGSLTVRDGGVLTNSGTIHGTVTLSSGLQRTSGPLRTAVPASLSNGFSGLGRTSGPFLVNTADGTLVACVVQSSGSAVNSGKMIDCAVSGGSLNNDGKIDKLLVTRNGTASSYGASAKVEDAVVESGSLTNENQAVITTLHVAGGSVENFGATIQNATLSAGRLRNASYDITDTATRAGKIDVVNASGGHLQNDEKSTIQELVLPPDHSLVLDNKGTIVQQKGEIITGYTLTDPTLTLVKNEYFGASHPSVTIGWTPVQAIGSTATAPVAYTLRFYDNQALAGDPVEVCNLDMTATTGGTYKLEFDTDYYVTLEATVGGGNVEVGKVLRYEALKIHTLPPPKNLAGLNVDKVTLKPGESFQFIAYDRQGKQEPEGAVKWYVEAAIGTKITSFDTNISSNGLLTVGADEKATGFIAGFSKDDGSLTFYNANIQILQVQPSLHSITVKSTAGGTAFASETSAEDGASILLFAKPDEGYKLDKWVCSAGNLLPQDDTFAMLDMPPEDVTITAYFTKIINHSTGSGGGSDGGSSTSFRDQEYGFWQTVKEKIDGAKSGDIVKVTARSYDRMPRNAMEALRKNRGVTLVINWNGGKTITIPAGTALAEPRRVFYPLAYLEKHYQEIETENAPPAKEQTAQASPAGGGSASTQTASKTIPKTGGVWEVEAPAAADSILSRIGEPEVTDAWRGLAESPTLAESGVEQPIPGIYAPATQPAKSSIDREMFTAIALLLAGLAGCGLLYAYKKKQKTAREQSR